MKTNSITKSSLRAAQANVERAFANVLQFENQPSAPVANGDALRPGQIYLANDSVFTQQYFDEPLTTYAVGYRDPNNIEATLDFLAPSTPVSRRFTYKLWTQVEEFLAESNSGDLRAIGGEFPTVKYTGSEAHSRTDNRGLRIRIDMDEVADPDSSLAGGVPAYQAKVIEKLKRRILRNSLIRTISIMAAGATNTNKTWSSGSPDADLDAATQIVAITTAAGIRPNKICYGDTSWTKRMIGYRSQLTAGSMASAQLNPSQVGDYLGVDAYVSRERYSSLGASMQEAVGNLVFLFYTQGADVEDPSNVKRFISPTEGGGPFRVYVQQVTSKLIDITVEHYEKIVLTSPIGLNTLTIS